jgi:hypothetical protein
MPNPFHTEQEPEEKIAGGMLIPPPERCPAQNSFSGQR